MEGTASRGDLPATCCDSLPPLIPWLRSRGRCCDGPAWSEAVSAKRSSSTIFGRSRARRSRARRSRSRRSCSRRSCIRRSCARQSCARRSCARRSSARRSSARRPILVAPSQVWHRPVVGLPQFIDRLRGLGRSAGEGPFVRSRPLDQRLPAARRPELTGRSWRSRASCSRRPACVPPSSAADSAPCPVGHGSRPRRQWLGWWDGRPMEKEARSVYRPGGWSVGLVICPLCRPVACLIEEWDGRSAGLRSLVPPLTLCSSFGT